MKSKYDYDTIRDYLHGLVDRETARQVRDLIRTDDVARSIAAGILQLEHEFNGEDHQVEGYIEELRQKRLKVIAERGTERKMSFGWVKIAAAILLINIVGAIVWFSLPKDAVVDLVAQELSVPYPLSVERGSSDAEPGFEAYFKGEYQTAIASFDKVENDATVIFYNGLSHLYAGDYDRAVTLLQSEAVGASRYQEQAAWFQSLALLKAGRDNEAKGILEKISGNTGHYKFDAARRLLSTSVH